MRPSKQIKLKADANPRRVPKLRSLSGPQTDIIPAQDNIVVFLPIAPSRKSILLLPYRRRHGHPSMASTSLSLLLSRLQAPHNGNNNVAHLQWIRLTRVLAPLALVLASVPVSYAAPLLALAAEKDGGDELEPKPADDPSLWIYLGTAVALVVIGGVFAGLTIAYVTSFLPFVVRWSSRVLYDCSDHEQTPTMHIIV